MTVLQEVVEVRADLAGRAPAAQLPQGRDHLVHPCSLEQPRVRLSQRVRCVALQRRSLTASESCFAA